MPSSPKESLATADAVFSGRAIAAFDGNPGPVISSADPIRVTFQVREVWKGPQQPTLTVQSMRNDASCGFSFKLGKDYIVYAESRNGTLDTNICTRTNRITEAELDLKELGAGQVVAAQDAAGSLLPNWFVVAGILVVIVVVVLLGMGTFVFQKRDGS